MNDWESRIVGHGEAEAASLMANPRNWRTHPKAQRAAVTGLLDQVGWVQNVIVNKRTGHVVDGHLRVEEATTRGASVPVVYVDLSEDEEALVLASLDPLAAMAGTDRERLNALLGDARANSVALAAMLARQGQVLDAAGLTDPDDVPDAPEEPSSKPGDLWLMGDHRVLCGDATDPHDVSIVMNGALAPWQAVSGPTHPMASRMSARRRSSSPSKGDTAETLEALLEGAFSAAHEVMAPGAAIYVAHPAGRGAVLFEEQFLARGWRLHQTLIWVKDRLVLGHRNP